MPVWWLTIENNHLDKLLCPDPSIISMSVLCFHSNIIITNHYKLIQHGQELSHRHQGIRVFKVKTDKDWEGWANRSLLTRRKVVSAKRWERSNQFVHSWGRVKWEVRKWEMVSKVFTFLSEVIPLLKAPGRWGIQLPCLAFFILSV